MWFRVISIFPTIRCALAPVSCLLFLVDNSLPFPHPSLRFLDSLVFPGTRALYSAYISIFQVCWTCLPSPPSSLVLARWITLSIPSTVRGPRSFGCKHVLASLVLPERDMMVALKHTVTPLIFVAFHEYTVCLAPKFSAQLLSHS